MKDKVYLILDNIRSRENVGSVFRTADAAGVGKIYLCGITPCPPHEKISKTALGAETYVFWEYHKQTWRLVKKLKAQGVKIIALEQTKQSQNIFKVGRPRYRGRPLPRVLALVLGNEVKGIRPKILKYCDKKISIPMYGKKESLNVAVAAGVAIYTLLSSE